MTTEIITTSTPSREQPPLSVLASAQHIVDCADETESNFAPTPRSASFWRGGSGRLYRHVVHSLIECPPLPRGIYILVGPASTSAREPLRIGITSSDAPTLNLAHIRRAGARLGAREVHVLIRAASVQDLKRMARDLRHGQSAA